MSQSRTLIVLAAGQGKRMKSALPKVLHPLLGRTLVGHVLAAAEPVDADRTLVVVGYGAERATAHLAEVAGHATPVVQGEQRGTGHAVRVALESVPEVAGTVVVLNGDVPLLRTETVTALIEAHEAAGAAATVLAAAVPDPTGLGRIVRTAEGGLDRIVEHRDATGEQLAIREINGGVYAFDGALLRVALSKLSTANEQGEEYLTDVFGLLGAAGHPIAVHLAADYTETLGCNDRAELAALRALLRDRINTNWMRAGVTILDPATTWIDATVRLERDAVVDQNTQLRGGTVVGAEAVVGPDSTLIDTEVGAAASVLRTHAEGAVIGDGATVGPFSYLRPGTRMGERAKVGAFVETKNATLGAGAKVPHLTYAGDATIGPKANIGAGTIFANYDGVNKHPTTVGEAAFVGSNTVLVAPVQVGQGAYTAAGSAIASDVPDGALGITRAQQHNSAGWTERKRPGTTSAAAAARARSEGEGSHRPSSGEGPGAAGDTASE